MIYWILTVALVALDQVVKALVRANIPLGGSAPFLPHVMELTYYRNTGAAFSLFSDHTWLLTIVSFVMAVLIAAAIAKKVFHTPFGLLALSVVLAGAVGNLIDRLFFGYVTDMFTTTFINSAVFNVADVCVVLGGIATVVYILFFYDRLEKKEGPNDSASAEG